MGRDFLFLDPRTDWLPQKEDGSSELNRPGMHWSFSNVGSAPSQLLSFKASSDDGLGKSACDSLASFGSMTVSRLDVERNRFGDKQAGSYYVTGANPQQYLNAQPISRPQEARTFPSPKHLSQVATKTPVVQSHVAASSEQNVICSSVKGGFTFVPPASVPPTSTSLVGFTDSRNATRSSAAPAQMTIFFGGSVYVYDDVSPEKARAIMLLAGNCSSASLSKTVPSAQIPPPITPITRPVPVDDLNGSGRSSMLSFSAVPSNGDQRRVKSVGAYDSSIRRHETPKAITSVAPARPTIFPAVALPLARKASLARFLEKRKERAMCMSPYAPGKRSPDHTGSASDSFSRSTNSAASCHHIDINQKL
ncbi:protein TIFY 6B-like isoform X2 [Rhodamnia argentea]|uniref:Protein TIFY n=1 Tax=Rhodamnia argentea TaxID=178133 RepID=A0A8B8Q239_9MYRT|nr:protein TIFY 6B-like isoform X2 [Rhodamnia argentea]